MATRLTLRDNLRDELKIDATGKVWSDSILNRNLEVAKRKIQQDGDFQWHFNDGENSEAAVVSQREYDLPSDFVRIEESTVRYDGTLLDKTTLNQLRRQNKDLTTDGRPAVYYLRGNSLGLYLRPDDTLTIDYLYRKRLADFVDDSTDSGMPAEFDEAQIQYASYLCWNDIQGRADKALEAIQNYKEMMEGLYAQYLGRRDEGNFQMGFEVVRYSSRDINHVR